MRRAAAELTTAAARRTDDQRTEHEREPVGRPSLERHPAALQTTAPSAQANSTSFHAEPRRQPVPRRRRPRGPPRRRSAPRARREHEQRADAARARIAIDHHDQRRAVLITRTGYGRKRGELLRPGGSSTSTTPRGRCRSASRTCPRGSQSNKTGTKRVQIEREPATHIVERTPYGETRQSSSTKRRWPSRPPSTCSTTALEKPRSKPPSRERTGAGRCGARRRAPQGTRRGSGRARCGRPR